MKEQELIDNIMDNFDFRKVEKAMKALNWTWDSAGGVPEEHDLRKCARERLKNALDDGFSGSGGFNARYSDGTLELYFSITEWEAFFNILGEVCCA